MKNKSVVLIDSKNLCYRFAWTHRNLSTNGFPTSVLFGALSGVLSLARRLPDTPFIWVWDGAGKTWRHELAPDAYKSNRREAGGKAGPSTEIVTDLYRQIPILQRFLSKLGFRSFEVPHLECDDLIGILATEISKKKIFDQVIIHSGDRDYYQLADGKRIRVLKKISQGKLLYADQKDIEKEFGVPCSRYTQLRALTGDPSDCIPKIFPYVGPKTAAKYIMEGLDPSKENFEDLPAKIQTRFRTITIRKEIVHVPERWTDIHRNYILSQIIRRRDDKLLPSYVRTQLKLKYKHKDFLRDPECCTDETYRYATEFFMRYDMADLMSRRHELWMMP